ncbi:MAG: hypothetical protein H9882_02085 [Candidatus Fournierella pullistercoris]|uniref:Uncharacterized protein n=1 Tax=Candidatus Allofournierella pullistercoris TaxID=2838597 RepID=A0A948WRF7_9FIRM|nr:hypothetical protein [Candidatus Fournierella pullistercoris]
MAKWAHSQIQLNPLYGKEAVCFDGVLPPVGVKKHCARMALKDLGELPEDEGK